ncbi:acetyltransferase, GNAT family [Corynebacterium efficiens YS-314]|nr:N-acetyltransferase [Corynebacterium efficiens]EEW50026.1 acetyltransferase, GNAT family [Corynebacterium efficiens YS-314]
MPLTFARARPEDTAAVQQVYRRIIDHLGATIDYPRWHQVGHPSPELIAAWITAGELYVVRDGADDNSILGSILGAVVLNHDTADGYGRADWSIDVPPGQVLVVHALGVLPERAGQGIARFILDATVDLARQQGMRAIRLDVYVDNTPALRLYTAYGFTDLGCHHLDYGTYGLTEFHLFELVL